MSDQPALEYETAVRDAKEYLEDPETKLFVFGAAQTTGTAKTMIARDLNGEVPEEVYLTVTAAILARLSDASEKSSRRSERMCLREQIERLMTMIEEFEQEGLFIPNYATVPYHTSRSF